MGKKRWREVGTFRVRYRDGRQDTVVITATEVDAATLSDPRDQWVEVSRAYRLQSDGTPVNLDGDGQLHNARTGEVLEQV